MLKIETIKNFNGFGNDGNKAGEYYYSQNMAKSYNGISNYWKMLLSKSTADIPALTSIIGSFAGSLINGVEYTFGLSIDNARFYSAQLGILNWELAYSPYSGSTTVGSYGSIIGDQKGRIIFSGLRYIGKRETTVDYTTGTVSVTNGSPNVTGTGTTFTSGMVGKMFRVSGTEEFYKVQTYTDATHIVLTNNYTGATNATAAYTIYTAWTDQVTSPYAWDLGADSYYYKPMETFEDSVFILNKNKVASINTTDDSFNAAAFTMPDGFIGKDIKSGVNGLLMGFYFNGRSCLVLWDGYSDRSKNSWIWMNCDILAIKQYNESWVVVTTRGIYITDGYSINQVTDKFIEGKINGGFLLNVPTPSCVNLINDDLLCWGYNLYNRTQNKLHLFNLKTKLYETVLPDNNESYGIGGGAIYPAYSSLFGGVKIHLSYSSGTLNKSYLSSLYNTPASQAFYIVKAGQGETNKVAEGLFLNIIPNNYNYDGLAMTFDISLKIANFKNQIWNLARQKVLATEYDKITINGSTYSNLNRNVGDEITIMDGTNAGQIRHITNITGRGTATEVWTLDSALPNYTAADTNISVSPFQLVKKKTYSSLTELKEVYFNIKNSIKGKQFLIKILIENATYPIEITDIKFIYDDLGLL